MGRFLGVLGENGHGYPMKLLELAEIRLTPLVQTGVLFSYINDQRLGVVLVILAQSLPEPDESCRLVPP